MILSLKYNQNFAPIKFISKYFIVFFILLCCNHLSSPALAMESYDELETKGPPKGLVLLPDTFFREMTTYLDPVSLCYLRAVNHLFKQIIPEPPVIIEDGKKLVDKTKTGERDSFNSFSYFPEDITIPYSYDAKNLGTYLQYTSNLRVLDLLQDYQIENSGEIFSYLTNLTNLRSLALPSLVWSHEVGFSDWLGKNTCLQGIILERSLNPRYDGKISVFQSLGLLSNLQEINIGNTVPKEMEIFAKSGLPHLKRLKSLKLPDHRLGKQGTQILCPALGQCTQLEELDLQAKKEKYDGTSEIASMLPNLPTLKKLKLLIGKEGALALTSILPTLSLKSFSITFPNCPENQSFIRSLGSLSKLEELKIDFQRVDSRISPFPQIQKLSHLKSLILNYSSLQDNSGTLQDGKNYQLLGSMFLDLVKLERLEICPSSSGQLNVNVLAPFFSNLKNLRVLSLSGLAPLKENKVVSLAKMLASLPCLEELNIRESISKMVLEKIIPSLQLSPNLNEFHFFCGKDFQNLFLILTQLKTLEKLHMFSVEQADWGSLRGLKNSLNKSQYHLQHSHLKEIYWEGYHFWNDEEEVQILKELSGILKSLPVLERIYFPKHAISPTGRHFLRSTAPSVRLCLYLGFWKGKNQK